MRRGGRLVCTWVVAASLVSASGCGGHAAPREPTSPSATTVAAPAACELVTPTDAALVMGWVRVTSTDHPFDSPVFKGQEREFTSACLHQPAPDDGVSFAALGVFTPDHMKNSFDHEVEDGLPLTGVDYTAWNVKGTVFVREGGVGFVVDAASSPGTRDLPAAARLADRGVSHLRASATPSPTPNADVAACRILTESVAEAFLGGADLVLDEGKALDTARSECVYVGASEPHKIILDVTEGPEARSDYDGIKKGSQDAGRYTPISGLGDEAFSNVDVFVLAQYTFMDLALIVPGEDRDVDAETDLARQLVARL